MEELVFFAALGVLGYMAMRAFSAVTDPIQREGEDKPIGGPSPTLAVVGIVKEAEPSPAFVVNGVPTTTTLDHGTEIPQTFEELVLSQGFMDGPAYIAVMHEIQAVSPPMTSEAKLSFIARLQQIRANATPMNADEEGFLVRTVDDGILAIKGGMFD